MPDYRNLTKDQLENLLIVIEQYFQELKKYRCTSSFYFCILMLCGYCQCYSHFEITEKDSIINEKVTVDDLKQF